VEERNGKWRRLRQFEIHSLNRIPHGVLKPVSFQLSLTLALRCLTKAEAPHHGSKHTLGTGLRSSVERVR
jgi:hypothetical protein